MLSGDEGHVENGAGPNDVGLSRQHIISARGEPAPPRVDHIDLYQLHEWDADTPLEALSTLEARPVRKGPLRRLSNFSGWHLMKALAITDQRNLERVVSQQIYYSLQAREAEYELVPISIDQGIGILVWSPLAGGLLSGKYRRDAEAPKGSRHSTDWDEPPIRDWDQTYDLIETLVEVGAHHGVSAARVALAYLLRKPGVTSLIIAARNEEQLADNLEAVNLNLSDDEMQTLDAISAPPMILSVLAPTTHGCRSPLQRCRPVAARATSPGRARSRLILLTEGRPLDPTRSTHSPAVQQPRRLGRPSA